MTSPLPTWTEPITARPSEIDFQNRWKPAAFFAAMQEAATHHAENLGFDFDEMIANNQVWLLARMRIRFLSFPQPGQALALTTWPRGVQQKIFFRREFQFLDEQDQPLALATSAWLLVDVNARRMLNPAALSGGLPLNEGLTALDEPLDKIALPAELPALAQRTAGYADVDMMGHVNNTRYVEWLTDLFPFEHHASRTLRWLQINYTNEVKPGARVELGAVESEAGVWLAAGTNLDTGQRAFEAALGWE